MASGPHAGFDAGDVLLDDGLGVHGLLDVEPVTLGGFGLVFVFISRLGPGLRGIELLFSDLAWVASAFRRLDLEAPVHLNRDFAWVGLFQHLDRRENLVVYLIVVARLELCLGKLLIGERRRR